MQAISDTYRPATLAEFVGNAKAVAAARWHIARGLGGKAFWISGASGIGKTTLARILASAVADELAIEEYDSADQITQPVFDSIARGLYCYGPGAKAGRVVIVNEAHGLAPRIVRQFLGLLERLPKHATLIFTTTNQGEHLLFEDIDGQPLVDRCQRIPLSSQGLSVPFATRFIEIAAAEGFTVPASKARELLSDGKSSLRAALAWLGSPQSMEYLTPDQTQAAA
jgi:replication-associated recombination protein RarA